MRSILIVGAGQCGLLLGHGLLQHGYDVTLLSARDPGQMRGARPTSTQVMFGPALGIEHELGLDLWAQTTPSITGLHMVVPTPDGGRVDVIGELAQPAQSTDQRLKMPGLLELFEQRGGTVIYGGVSTQDLDVFTSSVQFDLTIVAAGKGELGALFDRDPERSVHTVPQRALAVAYVHGMQPDPDTEVAPNVGFAAVPGAGEILVIPALTLTGACDIVLIEAIPGGPLDAFGDNPAPDVHIDRTRRLMAQHAPWLHQRCRQIEPTDTRATLSGRFTPTVRHPAAKLPSGGYVLGAADVVISNDPLGAQGANSAARCAKAYLDAIVARGSQPFDQAWMQATFEGFWAASGKAATDWTTVLLTLTTGPLPEHLQQVIGAASQIGEVAARLAHAFVDPTDFYHWLTPPGAQRYLGEVMARTPRPA